MLSGISAALFGVVIWAIFTDNRERVLMRELPQRRIVFQLLVCLGVLNFMFVFAQHIQRGLQTGDNKNSGIFENKWEILTWKVSDFLNFFEWNWNIQKRELDRV